MTCCYPDATIATYFPNVLSFRNENPKANQTYIQQFYIVQPIQGGNYFSKIQRLPQFFASFFRFIDGTFVIWWLHGRFVAHCFMEVELKNGTQEVS